MSVGSERLQSYLKDHDDSYLRFVGHSQSPESAVPFSPRYRKPSPPLRSSTAHSSASTSSLVSTERSTTSAASRSVFSRSDSGSSTSSAPSIPPWQPPPSLNQQLSAMAYNYGYDLPCDCVFLDCQVRFHPEYHQDWLRHCISHFTTGVLPRKAICTFCDVEFDSGAGDRVANYTNRLNHIGTHFYDSRTLVGNTTQSVHPRPDFFVLEHMVQTGLLLERDYQALIRHTERPYCYGLQQNGFVSPEQTKRDERREREDRRAGQHDQAKEDRQRKKERRTR